MEQIFRNSRGLRGPSASAPSAIASIGRCPVLTFQHDTNFLTRLRPEPCENVRRAAFDARLAHRWSGPWAVLGNHPSSGFTWEQTIVSARLFRPPLCFLLRDHRRGPRDVWWRFSPATIGRRFRRTVSTKILRNGRDGCARLFFARENRPPTSDGRVGSYYYVRKRRANTACEPICAGPFDSAKSII